jgi:hypothetical protein
MEPEEPMADAALRPEPWAGAATERRTCADPSGVLPAEVRGLAGRLSLRSERRSDCSSSAESSHSRHRCALRARGVGVGIDAALRAPGDGTYSGEGREPPGVAGGGRAAGVDAGRGASCGVAGGERVVVCSSSTLKHACSGGGGKRSAVGAATWCGDDAASLLGRVSAAAAARGDALHGSGSGGGGRSMATMRPLWRV